MLDAESINRGVKDKLSYYLDVTLGDTKDLERVLAEGAIREERSAQAVGWSISWGLKIDDYVRPGFGRNDSVGFAAHDKLNA